MSLVLKDQKIKMIISLIVMILLMFALQKLVNGDISFALLTIYGCTTTPVIMLKAGFFLFIILLQYFNAELILYFVENMNYICIRYGSKRRVFGVLLNRLIFLNIVFIGLSLLGTGVSMLVWRKDIQNVAASDIVVIALRGLGNCYLFSLIQVALLKYFDEAKCFGIMSLGALCITFFNPFDISFVTRLNFIYQLSFWGLFYLFLCFLTTLITRTIYVKEHTYGDRSI